MRNSRKQKVRNGAIVGLTLFSCSLLLCGIASLLICLSAYGNNGVTGEVITGCFIVASTFGMFCYSLIKLESICENN